MIDCLIIGQNDVDFEDHVRTIKYSFGKKSGAYQDQDLTFVTHKGDYYRAMDLINYANEDQLVKPLSNMDFIWPTILVLGSHLAKNGLTFDYVNEFKFEKESLAHKLRTNSYRSIAITTTLYVTEAPILDIIQFIREIDKDVNIIIGGPYIKNRTTGNPCNKLSVEFDRIGGDIYVDSSEGQQALVNVLKALKQGQCLSETDNLIFRKKYLKNTSAPHMGDEFTRPYSDDQFYFTKEEIEYNELADSTIDFSLFPQDTFNHFLSVATAKSCPYSCAFCGFPARAGKYKYMSVEEVEKEFDKIKDLGVDVLTILDDTFNVPKKRFKELLRMMIRNNYGFRWNSFYRSDQGDQETIELMAESGCEGVFLGMESGSNRMLEKMAKTSRREHYAAAIPLLRENNIYTHANIIIGFPGETEETVRESLEFIQEFKPDTYKAQLWYADNLTPVWQKREEYEIEGIGFSWSHYTMNSDQACDWIDYMYGEITDSAFLPQDGFGMWCIFYLQKMGMSRQQVLNFLKCFGEEILRKRQNPQDQEIPQKHLEQLLKLARIDQLNPNYRMSEGAIAV